MSRNLHLSFVGETSSNNTKISSKASVGSNANSFSQSTALRQPVVKSPGNTSSSVNDALSSISCDGTNYMSLASSENIGGFGSPYTVIVCFVGADYTSDTYLLSSDTADGHIGIKAGGGDIIFKAAVGKSSEKTIPTDTTNGGSVSHTLGADVEMIAFVSDGNNLINIYNIDGDLIGTDNGSGNSVALPIDHVLGKSDGTLGLDGELLEIDVFSSALSTSLIKGIGNKYKFFKAST